MSKLIARIPTMGQSVVAASRPKLAKFLYYAKVELVPPTPVEIGEAFKGIQKILNTAKSGKWKQITVKVRKREGVVNAVVATEVLCWFFIGEVIGKRSVVGYQV